MVPVRDPVIVPVREPVIVPARGPVIVPARDPALLDLDPVIVPAKERVTKDKVRIAAVSICRSCIMMMLLVNEPIRFGFGLRTVFSVCVGEHLNLHATQDI